MRTVITKHITAMLLIILPLSANAEFSIAGGADIWHDSGKPFYEVRYFGERWKHWTAYIGNDNTIGVDVYTNRYGGVQFAFGAEYADEQADIVATNWGYQIRIEYDLPNNWGVGVKHRSNCETVCDRNLLKWAQIGATGTVNHGFNYLFVRKRF